MSNWKKVFKILFGRWKTPDEMQEARIGVLKATRRDPGAIPRYYVRAGDNAIISALSKGKSIDNGKFSRYRCNSFEFTCIDEDVDTFCSFRSNPEEAVIEKDFICKFLAMLTGRELEVKEALEDIQESIRLDRIANGIKYHFPKKVRERCTKQHARRLGLSVEKFKETARDIHDKLCALSDQFR
jgi:transposase-like protein